jgi:beta-glucosidase-like glycosyl hydrolase
MGGTDIDSGNTYANNLAAAVDNGELDIKWARLGLKNSYKMRMMMGLFDPTVENKYQKIPLSVVGHVDSQMMSLNAARKGMVLLKQGPLPFAKGKAVAVIGQAVSSTADMTGNYDGGWFTPSPYHP